MNIKQALRADRNIRMALVGAGGKTSTMFLLAGEIQGSILLTCSTHLGRNQVVLAERHLVVTDEHQAAEIDINESEALLITGDVFDEERVSGVSQIVLDRLHQFCNDRQIPMIIEADGSRKLPIKAPAEHEPAVPPWANYVVVVIGLSGLNCRFSGKVVHRPERFKAITGIKDGELISIEILLKYLKHPLGGLKNIPDIARKAVLINHVDSRHQYEAAKIMAEELDNYYDRILLSSIKLNGISKDGHSGDEAVLSVYEQVSGLILAAGGSTRYGQPKVMLPWRGKPIIRQIAETALRARLKPVTVVIGAVKEPVYRALEGLPVEYVENHDWNSGQSSSVAAGLKSLPENVGAAVVMLADQPQIPVELIDKLIDLHRNTLAPVVAPDVDGQRANPVVLDRQIFRDILQTINGDIGARAVFSKYPIRYLPWHDTSILLDIDTPDDYERLLEYR